MKVKAAINVDVGGPLIIDDLISVTLVRPTLSSNNSPRGVPSQLHQMQTRRCPGLCAWARITGWCWLGAEVTHVSEGDRVMLTCAA